MAAQHSGVAEDAASTAALLEAAQQKIVTLTAELNAQTVHSAEQIAELQRAVVEARQRLTSSDREQELEARVHDLAQALDSRGDTEGELHKSALVCSHRLPLFRSLVAHVKNCS